GVGMGFLMQTSMLIAQNSVEQRDLGAASGAATFFRSIGGSFGISLFGAIFANRLAGSPAGGSFGGGEAGAGLDLERLRELPEQARELVLGGLADGISHVFAWAVLFTAAIPVLAWFIREVPLRSAADPTDDTPQERAEAALGKTPVA
ncbi:MFS transporter, partial [Micromonospora fluostatini]